MTKSKSTIKYKKLNGIAWVTMNRPEYNNAQNGKMTYDLDKAFKKAVDDDKEFLAQQEQIEPSKDQVNQ